MVLSLGIMLADAKTSLFKSVRFGLWTVASPLQFLSNLPHKAGGAVERTLADRSQLQREIADLKREVFHLRGLLTRHDAVLTENARLRQLYESRQRAREKMLVADLVMVSASPLTITLNKGRLHDVRVGQAVIDSVGLFGQVVETSALASRVLLITDSSHSVPVRVLRNDARAIATGDGEDGLILKDVPTTLDVREGDRLVTSGLGGRFLTGYPVGVVETVVADPVDMFANITARPAAALDRSRQVLVVLHANGASPPGNDALEAVEAVEERD